MSNPGAFLINDVFISDASAQAIVDKINAVGWDLTLSQGSYANEKWRVIKLIKAGQPLPVLAQFPEVKAMLEFFKCDIMELVFYSLLPGGQLHKHRDVSGTLELGCLRFHVPLVTHPAITFYAANEDIHMKKGELWAINTSYLHAVNNPTVDVDRIHIMMEVKVNDWVWSLLPKRNFRYYLHALFFFMMVGAKALQTLFEPSKFKGRLKLLKILMSNLLKKFKTT